MRVLKVSTLSPSEATNLDIYTQDQVVRAHLS